MNMNMKNQKQIKNEIFIYDIQDKIVEYLDIESLFTFLQTCKNIYSYIYYERYNYILCKKISLYFESLNNINLFYKIKENILRYLELKKILYKFYIHFKNHPETYLSEFLYELTEYKSNNTTIVLFEEIISYCSFTKNGENRYNFIKADELQHLIMNSDLNKLHLITKYIIILIEILEYGIFQRIQDHQNKEAKLLIEHLFYKHFWRNSEYVQDKITTLVSKCILYDNKNILSFIYNKRQHYCFLVNYQKVLTFIMSQQNIKYIDYIEEKRIQQNEECKLKDRNDLIGKIIIKPEDINNMMNNKKNKKLAKIIDIYLGTIINLEKYSMYIKCYDGLLLKVFEEMNVLKYFNEKNKQLLFKKK